MKEIIAKHLLTIEAVHLQPNEPFTWTSGIKSPIYCDNRLTLSYPSVRKDIIKGFVELYNEHIKKADVIAGTATAGIPHAALLADALELPMAYVRGSAKGHGKQNQIEGKVERGQKVVLVEDLISTGGSVVKAAEALREAGAEVVAVVAIFTYEFQKAVETMKDANIPTYILTNYSTLVEVASQNGYIHKDDVTKLSKWRNDPQSIEWLEQ
ncbi:orotate phosphoribosyltransferase [Alkalihalobacillus hemicellulosilyticus]|uniref:Orotate phosphoribosyltransferase n=1 Tax=Halalkalibacter hemicellulosilyticusJCM 9152 TaxID=1236971 RepID=W4QCS7_9BACI|nr:orotate phosphoribosyltransferase [Halalkalibacter hemicellulosilyticus]GAE29184.1 orotate phosphoribosyltransferase [Halalkalibacter hemicellulosilyticusJCM 9152]